MNKIIFLLLATAAYFIWDKRVQQQEKVSLREYQRGIASGEDNCTGKKFCVIAYVAPWCPSCKALAPQLKTFLAHSKDSKDNGMKVVVGEGVTAAENEADAAKYGYGAVADNSGVYKKRLRVEQFPSLFVVDRDGTIILRDQEAADYMSDKFRN